jgi:hypothetical protein
MAFLYAVVVFLAVFARNGRSWHGRVRDAVVGLFGAVLGYVGMVRFTAWVWGWTGPVHPTSFGECVLFCCGGGVAMFAMLVYQAFEESFFTKQQAHIANR